MATSSITMITTGGTIGSATEDKSVSVDQGQQQLEQHIQALCKSKSAVLKTRPAFNKNSEDLSPSDWLTLINTISDEIKSGCNKIIVTHGTDTMAYSATAIALCFRHLPVKIVLTGSCFTLDHPESDVSTNILGALASVSEDQIANGVYVSFQNTKKQIQVIDALSVKPMVFDQLTFQACYGEITGVFDSTLTHFQPAAIVERPQAQNIAIEAVKIDPQRLKQASQKVVQLCCYPGMNAGQLCAGLEAGSCVIVQLYHSGTASSKDCENSLIEAIQSRPDLTFLMSSLPSRYIPKPYLASVKLMQAGAAIYQDIQPHILHAFITLGIASGTSLKELLAALRPYQQEIPA